MRKHLKQLMSDIADDQPIAKSVLEIGSNDGLLLSMMSEYGYEVTGVDPAQNLAAIAESQRGVKTHVGFFDSNLAPDLGQYDIVIARHVFCHVDDWHDFIRGLEMVSHKETLVCIETPYAGDTLERCEWDQCYLEHLSYLTLKSIRFLIKDTNFYLHRVIRYDIHGGTVLLMLRHKDSMAKVAMDCFPIDDNITLQDWQNFAKRAKELQLDLRSKLDAFRILGNTVAGFGASAKSSVWINACGFTRKDIAFICDNTPQKQYKFSPGTDIPIADEGALLRELPDYTVMWCWNFASEVLATQKLYREKGGKFIIPIPEVTIV
jgi:SAM-dependent methyltransferase